MIVKTEAVILRSMRYRETSKIVTVFSRKFGKLRGIAKGARGPKSKFGAALEPMTFVSMVLYKHERRELHTISECEIVKLFPRLHADLNKINLGLIVVEFVEATVPEGEPSEAVFALLVEVLNELDLATKNIENVLYFFRLQILDLLGFRPTLHCCIRCRKKLVDIAPEEAAVSFEPRAGGVLCRNCSRLYPTRIRLRFQTVKLLRELLKRDASDVTTIELSDVSKKEMDEALALYARHHLVGLERLKTERVLRRLAV
jgi:DNA repair protein RecO (recombination protein O)